MEVLYSHKFLREYNKCLSEVRETAKEREKIFKLNSRHPILKTHKLKGRYSNLYSFSVNFHYRIIFEYLSKDSVVFHSIGDHSIYND